MLECLVRLEQGRIMKKKKTWLIITENETKFNVAKPRYYKENLC